MMKRLGTLMIASMPELLALSSAACLIHGASLIHPSGGWLMTGLVLALAARVTDGSGG